MMSLVDLLPENYKPLKYPEGYDKLAPMKQLSYKEGREKPIRLPEEKGEVSYRVNTPSLKPKGMTDEDWQTAISVFSPERVAELYKSFDPSSSLPFYQNVYEAIYKKPVPPDEKRLASIHSMASIGDALSLIAQGIAATQGSFIEKRNPTDDAAAKTDLQHERLRNAYRREQDIYNAGYWGAQIKDAEASREQYQRDRTALLALLSKQRDNAIKDKRFQGEMLYKYQKQKDDEAMQKERLRQIAHGNKLKRDRLNWDKQKYNLPRKETPKGFFDFYDSTSGLTYRVAEKKWKANFSQLFDRIKKDLFKKYPLLESQEKLGSLKPTDKEEYVKQYMYDNPRALQFLENIAETKFQDGKPETQSKIPEITIEQYQAIDALAHKYRKDEEKAITEIAKFLKAQGYDREAIAVLIKTIQDE